MQYNFINYDSKVDLCTLCVHDSNIGYGSDFSINGEVDFWTYYDGIHTYGCWNNFLFGTLYGGHALIGRHYNIMPIDGELYYLLNISMLIKIVARGKDQVLPSKGKFMWVTFEDAQWSEDKSEYFTIYPDSNWHTYTIDLSSKQKWVGHISNLRIYTIYENGRDGDEFFVKTIQIKSKESFFCDRLDCSYYSNYSHPCGGVGNRASCESSAILNDSFSIVKGSNDFLILDINGYGDAYVVLDELLDIKCHLLAKKLTCAIGAMNIGGYSEAEVVFNSLNRFIIYTGTYTDVSSIEIKYSKLAQELGFFDSKESPTYFVRPGSNPATIYKPLSSFKITPTQLVELTDNSTKSYVEFDPSLYNIEGGRNDWYLNGLGLSNIRVQADDTSSIFKRDFYLVEGRGKTLIDFSHPFNASGRINKVYVCGTVDYGYERFTGPDGTNYSQGEWGMGRLYSRGAKVKIFRPRKDGSVEAVIDIPIIDRKDPTTTLTSGRQEYTEADCDIFVNKGDFIGVYNVDLYYGKSTRIDIIDACYYTIEGDISLNTCVNPGPIKGEGNAGLLIYARSNQKQNRLRLTMDLNHRINVGDIKVKGKVLAEDIEYNIMRCLDFDWLVDLFGGSHKTSFRHELYWGKIYTYMCPNVAYGINRLNDGLYTVPDGKAADSFTMAGPTTGIVPVNPYYFWVNGDQEWLDVHYWPEYWRGHTHVDLYTSDPIAFTVIFPYGKGKMLHKFKVHFKEPYNFRSFSLSTYAGPLYRDGNADDNRFILIPEYSAVTLDGLKYSKDRANYVDADKYLFVNPSIGHAISKITGGPGWEWPGDAVIPGESTFSMNGIVLNNDQLEQAKSLDWKILQHEWVPFNTYGFRFYCFYHESTKICEMELFGYLSGGIAKIAAGASILTSFYGEDWFVGNISEDSLSNATCSINNSIRYIDIELNPINILALTDIEVSITEESLHFGKKGCEDDFFLSSDLLDEVGISQKVDIKNVYIDNVALFVDIAKSSSGEKKTLYYSDLSSKKSIESPLVGTTGFYNKESDFLLLNQNRNVAINCECYGLQNLLLGARAFYSHNDGFSWHPFNNGAPITTDYINFKNLPNTDYSVINIPVLYKSKFWRLALKAPDNVFNIREIMVYCDNTLVDIKTYHDTNADKNYTPARRRAPHLGNTSVVGSYYKLIDGEYITIELVEAEYIDKIVVYHDAVNHYTRRNSINKDCGIDRYTLLYITNTLDEIYDYSYYEHSNFYNNNVALVKNEYNLSFSKEFDFANDLTAHTNWRANFTSLSYVPSSGTLVGNTYEFPGYINFDIYLHYNASPICYCVLDINSDIYCYTNELINASFIIKVAMSIDSSYKDYRYSVNFGFLSGDNRIGGYGSARFGPQFTASTGGFSIIVQKWDGTEDIVYKAYNVINDAIYYYVFSSDGVGNYNLKVYMDAFDGINKVCDLSLYSSKQWESLYLGFCRGSYYDTSVHIYGKLYYLSLNGILVQSNDLKSLWPASLEFNSNIDSYLTVPFSNLFNFGNKKFSIDFFVKFNEFPYGVLNLVNNEVDLYPVDVSFSETGKYGWRGYFNGSAYIYMRSNNILNLSDNKFTIDFLFTFVNIANNASFFYKNNSYKFYYDATYRKFKFEGYQLGINKAINAEAAFDVELNRQYHIAMSRTDDDIRFFIDGAIIGEPTLVSGSIDFYYNISSSVNIDIYIGSNASATERAVGYMEEFRITKGVTRWTDSFTPPQTAYGVDSYTTLLCRFGRDYAVLIENYNNAAGAPSQQKAWSVRLIQYKTYHAFQFIYNSIKHTFDILINNYTGYSKLKKHVWHHVSINGGYYRSSYSAKTLDINIDGKKRSSCAYKNISNVVIAPGGNDLVIGKYLNGNLKNMCISSTDSDVNDDMLGVRLLEDYNANYAVPSKGYFRLYTVSVYTSIDNGLYGHHSDIDLYKKSKFSYFDDANIFSSKYNSLLAIDLGNRHDLSIVRSYGAANVAPFSLISNILYSNIEDTNPYKIFPIYTGVDNTFEVEDGINAFSSWVIETIGQSTLSVKDYTLNFKAIGSTAEASARASSKYLLKESFDFRFDYGIVQKPYYNWTFEMCLHNFNNPAHKVKFERGEINGVYQYRLSVLDTWHTTYSEVASSGSSALMSSIRVVRFGSFFIFYKKDVGTDFWVELFSYSVTTAYWEYTKIVFELKSQAPMYPEVEMYIDNIDLYQGKVYFSTYTDARWVVINVLNGDGVSRTITKVGIYPNIQTHLCPSGKIKNVRWTPLGKYITSYGDEVNLAYHARVFASSFISSMSYNHVVDGDMDSSWGSGYDDPTPYIIVDLGSVYDIYRVRLFYGENGGDTNYVVKNYTVSYSTLGDDYTLFASITNNTLLERNHDANPYITARYIKLNITSYSSRSITIYDPETKRYRDFTGAVVREIEVYKYNGAVISSEAYPIVAVDLNKQFYLGTDHEIIGVDYENKAVVDWDVATGNFCYSNYISNDINKVLFKEWGVIPSFEKWAVIKKDSATGYNDGPHYIRKLIVRSKTNELPISTSFWWSSIYSILSNSYEFLGMNYTLKINYVSNTVVDTIKFIEGDFFGLDPLCSWRDLFSFTLYINDTNNLDINYGYIYFGGYDSTEKHSPVIYSWNISSISGSLVNGINYIRLGFRYADDLVNTTVVGYQAIEEDTRNVKRIKFGTAGMVFRGTGNGDLIMAIENMRIERNHFDDYMVKNKGLYLTGRDYFTVPVANIKMSCGSFSFWIRTDFNLSGVDEYGVFCVRNIFSMINTSNDTFGLYIGPSGLVFYGGNINSGLTTFNIKSTESSRYKEQLFHVGVSFSNTGEHLDSDGSTIQLYINNRLYFRSFIKWASSDSKYFKLVFGGKNVFAASLSIIQRYSSMDSVISNLRICNYCKTDFREDMDLNYDNVRSVLYDSSDLIEISKDNVTFYRVGAPELPLLYEEVPYLDSRSVYIRSNLKKDNFPPGLVDRVAGLVVQWDIPIG